MRLEGQARGGFFAAPPEAVKAMMQHIAPNPNAAICDPCAGKGVALKIIAEHLQTPPEKIWALEIDERRAQDVHGLFPNSNVLAPASIFGCKVSPLSLSFVWLNAPYDDEIGGGQRCEHAFLVRAGYWLRPDGVMAFVVPERVTRDQDCQRFLSTWFEKVWMRPFPAAHRPYTETVMFAVKRAKPVPGKDLPWWSDVVCQGEQHYTLPDADGPGQFEKTELTDQEIIAALAGSPLQTLLEPPHDPPLSEPPLPLYKGHIALLLASGHLDGLVQPKDEAPHVVRGTAVKKEYLSDCTSDEMADGSVKTTTVMSEKICLTIRALGVDGEIRTFQ